MLRLVVVREHLQPDTHCDVIRRPHLYRDLDEIHDSHHNQEEEEESQRESVVTSQRQEKPPGADFLASDSSSVDFDDVTRPFKGELPPDVAAASSADLLLVARSDDSSLDDVTTETVGGGFFGRNGFLGKKSLRRRNQQKIPESETDDDGVNSKSLPNFRRASSSQVNPLKYPQHQEEEIPQLLVDGCYHGNVGCCHDDLPDLYACNTLPTPRRPEGKKTRRSSQSTSNS